MKFLYVRTTGTVAAIPARSVVGIYNSGQRAIDIYFNSLGAKNNNSGKITLSGFPANSEKEHNRVIKELSRELSSDNGNMFVLLADTKTNEFYDKLITGVSIELT